MRDARLSGKRVLIAEDDGMIAVAFATLLGDLGMHVVGVAPSVGEALAVVEDERLDAALLDVNLAGEAVFPVAEALRARGVGFVFLTGYDSGSLPERYVNAIALRKPVALPRLIEALRACLGARMPTRPVDAPPPGAAGPPETTWPP